MRLDGKDATRINSDLTAGNFDLAKAVRLKQNAKVSFMGNTKNGEFDVAGDLARAWLSLPANPNGRPNSDVLKPWVNGMDLTRRPAGKWIVDFGDAMEVGEAALYEAPFAHVAEYVQPVRKKNRAQKVREFWWRHEAPRPGMWKALDGLTRYIATPTVAKHRLFAWLDVCICPDHQLIVIARDDDTTFGILHSRFHEAWSLRLGTSLEDRPRYTLTTTFETFPFPEGLSPDIPATDYARRSPRPCYRRGSAATSRTARPLAQSARMGGVGGRAGVRLSQASGSARRSGGERAEEADADESLQRPPAMACRRAQSS